MCTRRTTVSPWHRWEMQDNADLEDEERVLVEKLRAEFFPRGNDDDEEAPGASQTQTESPAEEAEPTGENILR
ncbi:unnamed protein product [Boreogadus saida]